VPIDVLSVDATLRFDLTASSARATATMRFRTGDRSGNPTFDLRQEIEDAALDGDAIAPADVAAVDLGGGPGAEMRVLRRELAAKEEHALAFSYALNRPLVNASDLASRAFRRKLSPPGARADSAAAGIDDAPDSGERSRAGPSRLHCRDRGRGHRSWTTIPTTGRCSHPRSPTRTRPDRECSRLWRRNSGPIGCAR
jgi:hypothetical protein